MVPECEAASAILRKSVFEFWLSIIEKPSETKNASFCHGNGPAERSVLLNPINEALVSAATWSTIDLALPRTRTSYCVRDLVAALAWRGRGWPTSRNNCSTK